jgi:hypothetical protein
VSSGTNSWRKRSRRRAGGDCSRRAPAISWPRVRWPKQRHSSDHSRLIMGGWFAPIAVTWEAAGSWLPCA